MNILLIGGTRQIGYFLAQRLLAEGHRVTLLNRGMTPDDLPQSVARLHCDRTNAQQFRRALSGRSFDVVVDTVMYTQAEAEAVVNTLHGHVGRYIFISTGQVYLVRDGLARPFRESDYEGALIPRPAPNTYEYEEFIYGYDKRQAEDVFASAWREKQFPYTSLRLPMVNGRHDRFNRLYGYILRLKDGGPILVPQTPNYALRHIYVEDVVSAVMRLLKSDVGIGDAYNISQDETLSIAEFLDILGELLNVKPNLVYLPREILNEHALLPECSPFSDTWMSELDNSKSKAAFGMTYTPVREYLRALVDYHQTTPLPVPVGYKRRAAERLLAQQVQTQGNGISTL